MVYVDGGGSMMKMVCVIYNGVLYVVELVGDGVICLDMG